MRLATRFSLLLLGLAVLASSAEAFSLFGLGKKKDAAEVEEGQEKKPEESGPLPGMDAGGVDLSQPPRMAQEAEEAGKDAPPPAAETPPEAPAAAAAEGAADPAAAPPVSETETAVGDHPSGQLPEEVVITGQGGKFKANKPPLNIKVDAFESIRPSLEPDQALLLAESPLAVIWRRTHPEFLQNDRVVKPYLTTFSERPGVVFGPRQELEEVLQRKINDKESRGYQWSLTIADEEGKVFQHYEGSSSPPEELIWTGQNEQGDWMQAGAAYSPVYMFTDPGGTPSTKVGKPMRFKGIVHQERTGLHVSLDSAVMFGQTKAREEVQAEGMKLLRSAADLIKRRYTGIPIRVECYAQTKPLAERQCGGIERYLSAELMLLPQDISTDTLPVPYAEQRTEIILLNR